MGNDNIIGSEWVCEGDPPVKVVAINEQRICYERTDLSYGSVRIDLLSQIFKPHIKQKPPVKLYASEDMNDGEVKWFTKMESLYTGWQRRPDLDREVFND
jgi:hypothetical protein